MTLVDLHKERKKMLKTVPAVIFLLPLIAGASAAVSGIVPGLPNREWYSVPTALFYLKLHAFYWCIIVIGGFYRYITGRTPVIIGMLVTNVFAIFLGGMAFNFITPSLQDWRWVIPLALMYPAVTILPFINHRVSGLLHKELFATENPFARNLLWALPAMGITGATLSRMARGFANGLIGFAIIGLIAHLLLVWQTASFAHQIWKQLYRKPEDIDEPIS